LPTLSQDLSSRANYSRSLSALHAENQVLQRSFQNQAPFVNGARSLFGDSNTFGRLATSLNDSTKAASKPSDPICGLDEYLQRSRDGILEKIVNGEREHINEEIEKRVENDIQRSWEKEREWWMREIIGKDYVGKSFLPSPARRGHAGSRSGLLGSGGTDGGISLAVRGIKDAGASLGNLPSTRSTNRLNVANANVDQNVILQHVEVVKNIAKQGNEMGDTVAAFETIAQSMPPQQGYNYGVAWRLLACMLHQRSASPIERVIGSLEHLSKQFRDTMIGRVQSTGFNTNQPMLSIIQKYVDIEFGSNATLWHLIYFALRSGDAVAARNALQFAKEGEINESMHKALLSLGQKQGKLECMWETKSVALSSHETHDLEVLHDSLTAAGEANVHKVGSLALLCGNRMLPSADSVLGFGTIEDYIFGCQWKVIHSSDPMAAIAHLGEHIRGFDASYFDGQNGGDSSFALSLLASQQFSSALQCLAMSKSPTGLLEAAHLGLFILSVDDVVGDMGNGKSNTGVVNDILVAYASYLLTAVPEGSTMALLYLLKIADKVCRREEIASLVAQSYWTQGNLAGRLTSDGNRQNAILDNHMPYPESSEIIADAAQLVRKTSKSRQDIQNSLNLFMLSGNYSSVLLVLNQMMSPPDEVNPERTYWRQQSELLYSTHLSKRSLMLDCLQKEGKRQLVEITRCLCLLCLFFENLMLKKTDDCLEIMDSLRLLPRSGDDIAGKVEATKQLDATLQKCIPAFLRGSMECMYMQYRNTKSLAVAQSPTSKARLMKISEEGRALSTFAGLLGVDRNSRDAIARFEAYMT